MSFKYYDILSDLICGLVFIAVLAYKGPLEEPARWFMNANAIILMAVSYIVGYFICAIGSFLTLLYYKIRKQPSDNLLTLKDGKGHTGAWGIRFYETSKVISLVKEQMEVGSDVSTDKIFKFIMRQTDGEQSRIQDFNAQYAFSRSLLTTLLILLILDSIYVFQSPTLTCCEMLLSEACMLLVCFIAFVRFEQRGYYYAREVLNVYLKMNKK